MKKKAHKEPAIFDEVNREIELAKAENDTDKLQRLYLKKMEIAASTIQHKGLRDNLQADTLKLKRSN